jgi:hypothetical protein
MPEFLDQKRQEIDERLSELKPLVEEYARLQAAAEALAGVPAATATARPRGVQHSKTTKPRRAVATHAKRGRPKGTGTRSKQALEIVKQSPGITIPEIAEKMAIKQNYLYRVLPGLAEDGLVEKEGRGWRPKRAA